MNDGVELLIRRIRLNLRPAPYTPASSYHAEDANQGYERGVEETIKALRKVMKERGTR